MKCPYCGKRVEFVSEPKFVVFDKSETPLESWGRDAVTFGFLFLCIYVSKGSAWWTFFTGCIALLFMAGVVKACNRRIKKFGNKDDLRAWVESLE